MELLALDTQIEMEENKFWAQKSFYAEDLYKVGGMVGQGQFLFIF